MKGVEERLQMCLDTLEEISKSGYWPFASPAPCSTEVRIKEGIVGAMANLEHAIYWHQQMFTRLGRDEMRAPQVKIVN